MLLDPVWPTRGSAASAAPPPLGRRSARAPGRRSARAPARLAPEVSFRAFLFLCPSRSLRRRASSWDCGREGGEGSQKGKGEILPAALGRVRPQLALLLRRGGHVCRRAKAEGASTKAEVADRGTIASSDGLCNDHPHQSSPVRSIPLSSPEVSKSRTRSPLSRSRFSRRVSPVSSSMKGSPSRDSCFNKFRESS